jgi:hypothetical protein
MSVVDAFFVDSNVLLYVDPVEAGKRQRAAEWLDALWMAGAGRLSWQVLHEFIEIRLRRWCWNQRGPGSATGAGLSPHLRLTLPAQ